MHKWILSAVLCGLLSACSVGTHNTSKGVCHDIKLCDDGQCRTQNDTLTLKHCEEVGGRFEPANHKDSWFDF